MDKHTHTRAAVSAVEIRLCACTLIVQYAQYSRLPLSGHISIKLLPEAYTVSGDFKKLTLQLITCQETELTLSAHS